MGVLERREWLLGGLTWGLRVVESISSPLPSSFSFSFSSFPFLGFFQMEEIKRSGLRGYYQMILGTDFFLWEGVGTYLLAILRNW